mgnify:CR=1 FL=1
MYLMGKQRIYKKINDYSYINVNEIYFIPGLENMDIFCLPSKCKIYLYIYVC